MSDHGADSPLQLSDIDERLRSARPAPSDDALARAMTRAERARAGRKPSLLFASASGMSGKMRAVAVAGAFALVGLTAGAAVLNTSGSGGSAASPKFENAVHQEYCQPGLLVLEAQLAGTQTLLDLHLQLLPQFQNQILIAELQTQISTLQGQIQACASLP